MAKKIFFFVVYISVIYKANANSFSYVLSDACGRAQYDKIGLNDFDRKILVDSVNANRSYNSKRAKIIEWSDSLGELAQIWVNQCSISKIPQGCIPFRGYTNMHQLAYQGSEAEFPHEVVRNRWNTRKIINPSGNSKYEALNKIGCGRILANAGYYIICLFATKLPKL